MGEEEREDSCNMNHLAPSVALRGSVWDKGTDGSQTLLETIKAYHTLMRAYSGEPSAWAGLGVLPLPATVPAARPQQLLSSLLWACSASPGAAARQFKQGRVEGEHVLLGCVSHLAVKESMIPLGRWKATCSLPLHVV